MASKSKAEQVAIGLEALDALERAEQQGAQASIDAATDLAAGAIVTKNPELAPLRARIALRIRRAFGWLGSLLGG